MQLKTCETSVNIMALQTDQCILLGCLCGKGGLLRASICRDSSLLLHPCRASVRLTRKTKGTKDKLIFKEGSSFSLVFFLFFFLRGRGGVLIALMLNINWQQIAGEGQ